MHVHVSWIQFQFEVPKEISEAQYAAARERPDEMWQSIYTQVRARALRVASAAIIAAIVTTGCFLLAAHFDFAKSGELEAAIGESLVTAGCVVAISGLFTIASYLHYTITAAAFWRAVTKAAKDCESYSEFAADWRRRQQVGIGIDRKLPWWLPWLVLAGALLAVYFSVARY